MPSTRRRILAASGTAVTALAGCANLENPQNPPSVSPSDTSIPSPSPKDERSTQTPRNPSPLAVTGDWPQRGFDSGNVGVSDMAGVPVAGEAYWQLRRVHSGPAVLRAGHLFHYALLGTDTSETPTLTQTPPTGTAQPLDGRAALVCRDATSGQVRWYRTFPSPLGGWPAVGSNTVIVAGGGRVAGVRSTDGELLWEDDVGEYTLGNPMIADGLAIVPFQGAVDGGGNTIRKGRVHVYDIVSGDQTWRVTTSKRSNRVAAGRDVVVVTSSGHDGAGVVTAMSLDNGENQWQITLSADYFGAPTISRDAVFIPTNQDNLVALSVTNGDERWRVGIDQQAPGVAVGTDTLYVADGTALRALTIADGNERWAVIPGSQDGYDGIPAVGDEAVYVGTNAFPAEFRILSRVDGTEQWRYQLPKTTVDGDMVMSGLAAQPVVAGGAVYAYAVDGLYAFGPVER